MGCDGDPWTGGQRHPFVSNPTQHISAAAKHPPTHTYIHTVNDNNQQRTRPALGEMILGLDRPELLAQLKDDFERSVSGEGMDEWMDGSGVGERCVGGSIGRASGAMRLWRLQSHPSHSTITPTGPT